jgi:LuxR family quorum sensing-dependent transcriptional regulator
VDALTDTEIEVLRWAAEGKTSSEISVILEKSEQTVKNQMVSIRKKFEVQTTVQAVTAGFRMGILT